jgi:hypothetical protein
MNSRSPRIFELLQSTRTTERKPAVVWNKARGILVSSTELFGHAGEWTKMKAALIGAMIIGSSSAAMARETVTSHLPHKGRCVIDTACLPWQAPIGHHQPEAADLPGNPASAPSDQELQALDKSIDRKLTICRGC